MGRMISIEQVFFDILVEIFYVIKHSHI